MTHVLQEAIAEVSRLPEEAQNRIGQELLLHVDKLRQLRAQLKKGITSLNRGEGRELDVRDVVKRARARHANG